MKDIENRWTFDDLIGDYTIWVKSCPSCPIYQVTKDGHPPTESSGGYPNKEALLKLKGMSARKER